MRPGTPAAHPKRTFCSRCALRSDTRCSSFWSSLSCCASVCILILLWYALSSSISCWSCSLRAWHSASWASSSRSCKIIAKTTFRQTSASNFSALTLVTKRSSFSKPGSLWWWWQNEKAAGLHKQLLPPSHGGRSLREDPLLKPQHVRGSGESTFCRMLITRGEVPPDALFETVLTNTTASLTIQCRLMGRLHPHPCAALPGTPRPGAGGARRCTYRL